MLKTTKLIEYHAAPIGYIATIPAGTKLDPASNLPAEPGNAKYWARAWPRMTNQAKSWRQNYGFLVGEKDL